MEQEWHPEEEGQTTPKDQPAEGDDTATLDTLQANLEEAERERGQYKALLQRVQADFLNYKRRTEEERQEMVKHTSADLILKLLPILDDFQRALDHVPANTDEAQWMEGMSLVERKFQALLEAEGVNRIQAQGQRFDPWEHEALFHEESSEEPEGTVLRVIRDGYKLHDRVLRPAQVSVARGSEQAEESHQNDDPTRGKDDPTRGEKEA